MARAERGGDYLPGLPCPLFVPHHVPHHAASTCLPVRPSLSLSVCASVPPLLTHSAPSHSVPPCVALAYLLRTSLLPQADHHCKALKCQDTPHRLTLFNELGQPVLSLAVASTSYKDRGARLAFEALNRVWNDGRPKMQQVTIDAPARDAPGIIALMPMLAEGDGAPYAFKGSVEIMDIADDRLPDLLRQMERESLASTTAKGILGLDTEWRTPPRNPIALMQFATEKTALLLRMFTVLPHERPITIPDALVKFLINDQLMFVGRGIAGDFDKLRDDATPEVALQLAEENTHFMDLGELAAGKSGVQKRAHQWGLASLSLQFTGEVLLKGDVARSNWERVPNLKPGQVTYATNDAAVALPIYVALEPPDLDAIPEALTPSGLAGAAQRAGTALREMRAGEAASAWTSTSTSADASASVPTSTSTSAAAAASAPDSTSASAPTEALAQLPQEGASQPACSAAAATALRGVGGPVSLGSSEAQDGEAVEPDSAPGLLEGCEKAIVAYSESSQRTALRLPANLTAPERAVLHECARAYGLSSTTVDDDDGQQSDDNSSEGNGESKVRDNSGTATSHVQRSRVLVISKQRARGGDGAAPDAESARDAAQSEGLCGAGRGGGTHTQTHERLAVSDMRERRRA